MQLKDLIDNLQQYSKSTGKIKRFHFDFKDQIDVFAKESDTYPMVFISPIMNQSVSNKNGFSGILFMMDIFVLDKIRHDRTNILTIMNDTNNIITDFVTYIKGINGINVNEISDIFPYNDFTVSMLAGNTLTMSMLINIDTVCEYPTSDSNFECPSSNINIYNSVNDLLNNIEILSGSDENIFIGDAKFKVNVKNQKGNLLDSVDYLIPAQSDTDAEIVVTTSTINVQNTNGSYDVTTADDLVIPDTEHLINLKDSNGITKENKNYTIPSTENKTDNIIIGDTIIEVYLNDTLQDVVNIKFGDNGTIDFE